MVKSSSKGGEIAAQTLFMASSAANAIPVAGQFVSAGLAIAGLFVKIFAGKKAKKAKEAKAKREKALSTATDAVQATRKAGVGAGVGLGSGSAPVGSTAPVSGPDAPSFSTWGGGSAPSVQPVQQALNNKVGI
jgi:hypothetical protein